MQTQETSGSDTSSIFSFGVIKIIVGLVLFFALVRADFGLALPAAGVLLIACGTDLWSRFASSRLKLDMTLDRDRVFPGESLTLTVELQNLKILPVWVELELPSPRHLGNRPIPTEEMGNPLRGQTRLLSWEKSRRDWMLFAERRGVSSLGPAQISAGDLLGLCKRTRNQDEAREVIVFPRRLQLKTLDVPFQEYFGAHTAQGPVEDPAWYVGTRDYTGSRPAKNIHWKASARLGVLQEKLYEPTFQRKVLFILDTGDYLSQDYIPEQGEVISAASAADFEFMIETLGTLAAALAETGASFGLVTNAPLAGGKQRHILPSGRGPEHLGNLLETLARIKEGTPANLGELIRDASPGFQGFVFCGAAPGDRIRNICRGIPGRKKGLFVFSNPSNSDTDVPLSLWENYPACLARDICEAVQ
jgi:uncharacterized protein (DUF58 family)